MVGAHRGLHCCNGGGSFSVERFTKQEHCNRRNGKTCCAVFFRPECIEGKPESFFAQAGADIDPRNSALDFDFVRRLSKSSIASTVERGLKTLRRTQTRASSSGGRSNSSLRVPER